MRLKDQIKIYNSKELLHKMYDEMKTRRLEKREKESKNVTNNYNINIVNINSK